MNTTDFDETKEVTSRTIHCDGGTLGHPRVYLTMDDDNQVVCPYCSCRFVLKPGSKEPAGH